MAGTLTIDTLKSSTSGPTVFQNTSGTEIGQLCKAWVNFNGTTSPGTIRASFNVGSVTKNGTGDYTVNFTNAMSDANYSVTGSSDRSGSLQCTSLAINNTVAPTTTTVRVRTDQNGTALDGTYICVSIFR